MFDWAQYHRDQVNDLVSKGWSILAVGVSIEEKESKSKRRAYPVGTQWKWTSGTVIAPPNAVYLTRQAEQEGRV